MSRSSDLQIETMNLASSWLWLIPKLLSQPLIGQASSQRPEEVPYGEEEWEIYQRVPDLAFTPTGQTEPIAVEFTMLRWRKGWLGRVAQALIHLERILARGAFHRGILIVTAELSPEWLTELNAGADHRVEVWDLKKLRDLAAKDAALSEALEDLAAETMLDGPAPERLPSADNETLGAVIAAKLRKTEAGSAGWSMFEARCYDAIRLLFAGELQSLTAQQRSDDGLNRMDLIGRIRAEPNTFWSIIAHDFQSRYVVFEAKNYTEEIGQGQIHSTAKYLMRNGLRRVAVLLTREGASENAKQASAGYLRHDGFLILTLSLADLCNMLEGFDAGATPETLLFERMDKALMALNR